MTYSYPEIKNFHGLYLQANSFSVPDGALEVAENVVLIKDAVLTKVRGNYEYLTKGAKNFNKLFMYRGYLFGMYYDQLAYITGSTPYPITYPNEIGTAHVLSGATVSVSATDPATGLDTVRSRSAEANNNLYFTTDNGVLKLENYNSAIYKSGIPPALDLWGTFLSSNGGIAGDAQVAYRVVFGRRDANNNLLLGAPGDIITLTNALNEDCSWTRGGSVSPWTITVTVAGGHTLTNGMVIDVTNADVAALVGTYTVTVTAPTTFTFSFIGTDPGAGGGAGNVIDYKTTRSTHLDFSIPAEITSSTDGYFYRVYRSSPSSGTDVVPFIDFRLVDEQAISAADLSRKYVIFDDDVLDIFVSQGEELYTNPNSREGEVQANNKAPLCTDICTFKNHVFYANCTTRHSIDLSILTTSTAFINEGDTIQLQVGTTTTVLIARNGIGNENTTVTATGTGTITITCASHGLHNGDTIYAANITGTLTPDFYIISNVATNTFDISAPTKTATVLDITAIYDVSGNYIFKLSPSAGTSVAGPIDRTARAIVKAINYSGAVVYAHYISTPDGIPGKMRIDAQGFTAAIYLKANTTTVGSIFLPPLPSTFSTVYSRNDVLPNTFYSSKIGEPESVPLVNLFPVGSRNKKILRMIALRDSVIFLKEDGVYRCDGDSIYNFAVTLVDKTAICIAESSADVINNQVAYLSNQGVCLATPNSVKIISRDIEEPIRAVLGYSYIAEQTSGISYESSRFYYLTTVKPNSTKADITYIYNAINESWTTATFLVKEAIIGPSDTMFFIDRTTGSIQRERKTQTKYDYSGQNYAATVVSVSSDLKTIEVTSAGLVEPGDVFEHDSVFSRVLTAVYNAPLSQWTCTLRDATNMAALDDATHYKNITSSVKLAPFHAGAIGRQKQFAQMQVHSRDDSITTLAIEFNNNIYGGSTEVLWSSVDVLPTAGWGFSPWGFFEWGLQNATESPVDTRTAAIIRVYIPLIVQRGTYIQPYLTHSNAGEAMNIQAITFAVRGYGERVSK